jgi:dihydrofolate synthase / folylpolyglutamate synthase
MKSMKPEVRGKFNTWEAVESWVLGMPRFSDVGSRASRFALDQIEIFSKEIGSPHQDFPSIHVAGTNGKGTVCSTLAAVYTQSGYKTGLYTSPHLSDVRERVRVNGVMISREDMMLFFQTYETVLEQHPLTFFELTTALSFWYFSREVVDIAIIETGLGGRLDATNIVDPLVSVITGIGFDHQEQLGNTLSSIAFEKAGIIKSGKPLVTGDMANEAMQVIAEQCALKGGVRSELAVLVTTESPSSLRITTPCTTIAVEPDIRSGFEQSNLRVVAETVTLLQSRFPVSDIDFKQALGQVRELSGLRGRFEKLHPNYRWYFDGAHNLQALAGVINQINRLGDLSSAVCICSIMQDKLTPELCAILNNFGRIYYHELNIPRCATFESVNALLPNTLRIRVEDLSILETLKTDLVLYTGSFYFYSTVSEWVGMLTDSP